MVVNTGFKTSKSNDLHIGKIGEDKVLQRLLERDASFIKSANRFEKWDFKNDKEEYWEAKTRTNAKGKYPTTYIPTHKVLEGKDQFFLFNFTDVMCYIKYDAEVFKTFKVENLNDRRGGYDKVVPHYCIPISLLIDL
jgi:hypothetical protein